MGTHFPSFFTNLLIQVNAGTDDILRPQSVYGLTCGSCLLLAGSVADVIGSRLVCLTGILLNGIFIAACGLPRTGIQLIMFRAIGGIAISLALPTSVSILSTAIPSGKRRNVAFSCLGLGQVLGFSLGLVLAGVFLDTIGWRAGFYLAGAVTIAVFVIALWALPMDQRSGSPILGRLRTEIDWVGAGIASTCLALLSYVLTMITSDVANMRQASNIVILSVSLALVPAFIFRMARRERMQKPVLIPNSLWKNRAFTCVCLMMLLVYAEMQTMELFASLFFQQVQELSALQTSIRILPSLAVGAVLELSTGFLVHQLPVLHLILISTALSVGAPLLMAVINPNWPYWYDAFPAQLLMPFSVDVHFTVGILVVSDVFPDKTQGLAGAVFSTVRQFGISIGLAVMGIISNAVTRNSKYVDKTTPQALEEGYRATFWAAFASMVLACGIGAYGFRKIGKVGVKRE